jgi:hypothetical protein
MSHAYLQPSSAHRWLVCPGSVALSQNVPDRAGEAADMGTACHMLLSRMVKEAGALAWPSAVTVSDPDTGHTATVPVTAEMKAWVMRVYEWLGEWGSDGLGGIGWHSELTVPIGEHFGCRDDFWGTADLVAYSSGLLVVADAKFGFHTVEADGNAQLRFYALGALRWVQKRVNRVELYILQPRSDELARKETLTVDELLQWGEEVRPKVMRALQPAGELVPSENGCRWCAAAGVCPALAEQVKRLVLREFAHPALLAPDALGDYIYELEHADTMLRIALDAARLHALQLLGAGQPVKGWKRVAPRRHRKWIAEAEVVRQLSLLVNPDDLYERGLRSPAQVEKMLRLPKGLLDVLAPVPPGDPVLAPEDDERPAIPGDFAKEDA